VLSLITIFFPGLSPFVAGVELVMLLMLYTNLPSLVTTCTPDAFCWGMVVSADFFEQLTNANVITASATTDVWFFTASNQTPCSR